MRCRSRWMVVGLIGLGPVLACAKPSTPGDRTKPATVEPVEGTGLSRVTLSPKAAERLGIQTTPLRQERVIRKRAGGGTRVEKPRKVIPYGAVIYDTHGDAWAYTNPEALVFVRHGIGVDYIEGDRAVLSEGPPAGTAIVTVGAAELFGTEFESGH
jgi:hypothetical protein